MKRYLLSALLLVFVFPISFTTKAQDIKLGIRAGGNISSWRGDAVSNIQSALNLANVYLNEEVATPQVRTGFHAGVYASLPISQSFTLEPGVYFTQKGSQLNSRLISEQYDFLDLQTTLTSKLNYIDVPLYAKVNITDGLHIFAGPQVSFLVSNQLNTKVNVAGFSLLNRDWDLDPGYQKVDVGASAGVGYQLANGLNLRASYDRGFQRLTNMESLRAYNQNVKISVGYEF